MSSGKKHLALPLLPLLLLPLATFPSPLALAQQSRDLTAPINLNPPHFSTDKSVKLDYDIVYVRAPRKGDAVGTNWTEISNPVYMDPGADLMLLHPDGSEEVLVRGGAGSVTPKAGTRLCESPGTRPTWHS